MERKVQRINVDGIEVVTVGGSSPVRRAIQKEMRDLSDRVWNEVMAPPIPGAAVGPNKAKISKKP